MDEKRWYHIAHMNPAGEKSTSPNMPLSYAVSSAEHVTNGWKHKAKSGYHWIMDDGSQYAVERAEYKTLPELKPVSIFESDDPSKDEKQHDDTETALIEARDEDGLVLYRQFKKEEEKEEARHQAALTEIKHEYNRARWHLNEAKAAKAKGDA